MKYLEDARFTQLTSDLTGASLNTRGRHGPPHHAASSSSSCRRLHGRVEAYTTKRTGADKKTAVKVGLQYAKEMAAFNAAVEACWRRKRERAAAAAGEGGGAAAMATVAALPTAREQKIERRRLGRQRSVSVDGVTFAADKTAEATKATMIPLVPLKEGAVVEEMTAKRQRPLASILKRPSAARNKRSRAASFDSSTRSPLKGSGPAASPRWTPINGWGSVGKVAGGQDDRGTHPLIPQPSLYQSFGHEAGDVKPATTMVPRRLVTDLILTLNASFPDYDFSAAQVSDFCTLSLPEAARRLEGRLGEFEHTTDRGRGFRPRLWGALEDALGGLENVEVYSYAPRGGSGEAEDPLEFLTRDLAAAADGIGPSDDGVGGRGVSEGREEGGSAGVPVEGGQAGGNEAAASDAGLAAALARARPAPLASLPPSDAAPPHVTLWSMNYFFVGGNKKRIVLFACVETMRSPRDGGGASADEEDYDDGENALVFDEARRTQEAATAAAREGGGEAYPTSKTGSGGFSSFARASAGEKSVRDVTLEDTDVEEDDADLGDADGEEAYYGEHDFDTGRLRVPSWVA